MPEDPLFRYPEGLGRVAGGSAVLPVRVVGERVHRGVQAVYAVGDGRAVLYHHLGGHGGVRQAHVAQAWGGVQRSVQLVRAVLAYGGQGCGAAARARRCESDCSSESELVDCYERYERADEDSRELNLRPFAVGLAVKRNVSRRLWRLS